MIDKQNNHETLVPCRGNSYPDTTIKQVKRTHDVNYLSEGRQADRLAALSKYLFNGPLLLRCNNRRRGSSFEKLS